MSRDASESLSINPPIMELDTIIIASATSSAQLIIPTAWMRSWITIEPDGCDCYFGFTFDTGESVDQTAVTTLSSEAVSAHGNGECLKVSNGAAKHFDLSKVANRNDVLYLTHKETAASAYVRISRSSGQTLKDV